MLRIEDLCKSYGSQVLFEDASLTMVAGERLGLVGRNGFGKSTLFRMILGEVHEDAGSITLPKHYRIGHLAQHLHFTAPTILEEACLGLPPGEEYDHYKAERILFGLGFTEPDLQRAPAEFSGGFQVRLNLAKVLVSAPHLLLLDEPTNYLDIVSIRWMTRFLRAWPNELILISHDREFMDAVTTHTALIHRHTIRRVEGPTGKLYALVAQDEATYEKTRQNQEKQRKHAEAFITRFRAQAGKAAMVQSRVKMLEKMPQQEKLATIRNLDFQFHYAPFAAKTLMEISDVSFAFEPDAPLIAQFRCTIHAHDRIAVIGKNGKGKSTLLNLLAGELPPQTGTIRCHPNLQLGYFGQTNIDRLTPTSTVEEEIAHANRALTRTQVRTICGIMMFGGDHAEKKVTALSGGEKSRVMLGKILAAPANLLFLDEPTNHLDMHSIDALVDSIEQFPGASVIVTHSEAILRRVATRLIVFHRGGVELFPGTYDEFLETIGWEDEAAPTGATSRPSTTTVAPATPLPTPPQNKKMLRKQRADILAERARVVDPVKKEVADLEAKICALEAVVAQANATLLEASRTQQVDAFVASSKIVKDAQKAIDAHFVRLEQRAKRLQELVEQYDTQLATVEQ